MGGQRSTGFVSETIILKLRAVEEIRFIARGYHNTAVDLQRGKTYDESSQETLRLMLWCRTLALGGRFLKTICKLLLESNLENHENFKAVQDNQTMTKLISTSALKPYVPSVLWMKQRS